jgi:RNA polymerase sigma factor (sigma-70 family)
MGSMIAFLPRERLEAAVHGDPAACLDVLSAWAPVVLGWCDRLGSPDPEEAAHGVLDLVLVRLPSLRSIDAFPGWILTFTRREVARQRRRAWYRRWLPASASVLAGAEDPSAGPVRRAEEAEIVFRVREALDALPESSRVIIVLCDIEERTDDEIGALLGIPKGTVKSRLRVARARFSKLARARRLNEMVSVLSERRET